MIVLFIKLKGVGQQNSLKWGVFSPHKAVVGRLDVDGCDIIGEKNNLVGVDLLIVFIRKVLHVNQAALNQACDEGPGPREWVQYMDILTAERFAKLQWILNPIRAHPYAFIKTGEGIGLFLQMVFLEEIENLIHGPGYGILVGKAVVVK